MQNPLKKKLVPIKELQDIRGISLPIGLEFLQLVVTGPPGAGKTYYINQIGGWPNEGYIDLTRKGWWKDQSLIYRPREINLGLPFKGCKEAFTIFDKEWVEASPPLQLELDRIKVPPGKESLFSTNWRGRYIFEFLIPSPEVIYEQRMQRHSEGYFPVDDNLSFATVERQVAEYRQLALYLHRAGISVYIRENLTDKPMRIVEKGDVNLPLWVIQQPNIRPNLRTLAGWKWLLLRKDPNRWLTLTKEPQSIKKESRISHDGQSFEMLLGKQQFLCQPEFPLGATKKYLRHNKHWLISTQDGCSTGVISGFARIKMGETVMIGRANTEYDNIFGLDKSISKRHLNITNLKGDLIITPLGIDNIIEVSRKASQDHREKVEANRYKSLVSINELLEQPAKWVEEEEALYLLKSTLKILQTEAYRPLADDGSPGGLLELPSEPTPIIIGDLHANVNNLLKILSEKCLLECLNRNSVYLVILGDAVHSEISGEMDDMVSSILIMDLIFKLKNLFPKNVFYLRGNHDSFDENISKNGVLQGVLMQEALQKLRGEEYAKLMEQLYDLLPYVAISDSFMACHAAPPLIESKKKDIINIKAHPDLLNHIISKRLKQYNHYKGYSKSDVKRFRKSLGVTKGSAFIVGHTPLDPFGSVWRNVGAIKNHHIIYSAHQDGPAFFARINDQIQPLSYPAEPLTQILLKLQ